MAVGKEIVHFLVRDGGNRDGRGWTGIDTVVIDLCLELAHGRAGQGGKDRRSIDRKTLFHCQ